MNIIPTSHLFSLIVGTITGSVRHQYPSTAPCHARYGGMATVNGHLSAEEFGFHLHFVLQTRRNEPRRWKSVKVPKCIFDSPPVTEAGTVLFDERMRAPLFGNLAGRSIGIKESELLAALPKGQIMRTDDQQLLFSVKKKGAGLLIARIMDDRLASLETNQWHATGT